MIPLVPTPKYTRLPTTAGEESTSAEVDSSPAVVGNRVYFGVGTSGIMSGPKGSICCVDADTGAMAWRWTGDKELPTPLRPIFSSPVIWVEPSEKGATPAAR